ncbi:MAG: SDR family NAD(P)-dependent oxidoreductase [Alphaproteobacteria bacterium]
MSSFERCVVTGAGSGLGRALALRLARPDAVLLLADLDRAACEQTATLAGERGAAAHVRVVDVSDAEQVGRLAEEADALLSERIDLVVNNAGVAVAGAVGETPLDDWHWIVDTNLFGVVHGCHFFAPRLAARGRGAILNVASMAGLVSVPTMAAYNATKAAVVALSETLAAELRAKGVTVTVLCPSFFDTHLLDRGRFASADLERAGRRAFAQARMTADDVAAVGLRDAAAGRLHSVPMLDGRLAWLAKRAAPGLFTRVLSSERLQKLARG